MTTHHPGALAAPAIIKKKVADFTPRVGIILGSGLGSLVQQIEKAITIPYSELPDFPECTVAGHAGNLVLGYLRGVPVACLQGRAHYYEGYAHHNIQALVRTLKSLGCETLLLTNAAGSLRADVGPGSLMLITDHINFQSTNPLVGKNHEEFGERFVDMSDAYDPELRAQMQAVAEKLNIKLDTGVYLAVLGPSFETPAEIRAYRAWGADAVAMSLAAETIVARHCNMRVVAISAISNLAAGLSAEKLSHEQTLQGVQLGVGNLINLITHFVAGFK